jgi:signal transduction histidine kinase
METEKIVLPPRPARDAQSPKGGFKNYGLFRSKDQRIIAGVAGGLGERFGVDPVLVRIAFALLSLSGLAGVVLYAVLWALMPESDGTAGPFLPPKTQRAVAMGMIVLGVMILLRPLGLWLGDTAASSLSLAALGAGVIWLSSPESKRQRWSRNLSERMPDHPLETLGANDRVGRLRLGAGALFFAGGILLFLQRTNALEAAPGIVLAVVATMGGLGILFGPWGWRLLRQLTEERRERIRSEERADMAAHLHDSVLQTLALIQRTDQPKEMVALARNQERELRAWLNGTPTHRDQMLSGAVEAAASAVELQFKVPIEVVTVGDAPMDERMQAVVEACREATVNAAKHSGAEQISVYVEVEPDAVTTFVRDEGSGFDPAAVAPDRRGIAESIRGRMERSGGSVVITTEPGGGTEVQLTMARSK